MIFLVTTNRLKIQWINFLIAMVFLMLPEIYNAQRVFDEFSQHQVYPSPFEPVTYSLTLKCENHKYWCAEWFLRELDKTSAHDPWMYGFMCSNQSTANVVTNVKLFPGGDGPQRKKYQVSTLVFHNCTSEIHENTYECYYNIPGSKCRNAWMSNPKNWKQNYTCACNVPKHQVMTVLPIGVIDEEIELDDSMNTYDIENIEKCQYPAEFYSLRDDPKFSKVFAPPCTWKKLDWEYENQIINFVEDDRSGPITLNITLSCKEQPYWCADLYLSEWDDFYSSEELFFGTVCTHNGTAKFSGITLFLEGDGFFDMEYEILTKLYHNCTNLKHTTKYDCPWNIKKDTKCPGDLFPSKIDSLKKLRKCDCVTEYTKYPVGKRRTINKVYELRTGDRAFDNKNENNCHYPYEFIAANEKWDKPLRWFHAPCNWTATERENEQYGISFVKSNQPQILMRDDLAALKIPKFPLNH